jgi:heptosyltransferase I
VSARPDPELVAALARARHVCVVLLTGLGDVVHGLPVVNALKRARPDLRITWVAEPMPAGLLTPHPGIDRVVAFHKQQGWRGVRALRRELRGDRFDLTLNFNIYFKSVFPTVLSRAPVRLGFDRARSRDGVWMVHTHRLPPGPRRHTQDLFLEFVAQLGVGAEPLEWRLEPADHERAEARAFFAPLDGAPVAVIVPASANRKKDWFAQGWAAVADALHERGFRVVLAGGPGARETAIARRIVEAAVQPPVWGLGDGVRRLLWLLGGARLVLAPDTGPVHIARALDVPVIGLYGHTNPWRVGPYRAYEDLWVDTYTDAGEGRDASTADARLGRMERITVDDVLARVDRAVREYRVLGA